VLIRSLTVFVALMVIGNGVILGLSAWARTSTPIARLDIDGVRKAVAVDADVWRGGAPSAEGYRNLAEAGVATVVDLRSDSERGSATAVLDDLDVRLVRIPIRDGQLPSVADVERFVDVVDESDGVVFVHCGAGVGRTGAMVAAYRAAVGDKTGALRDNLAVGPPSLEQIAYAASGGDDPWAGITVASRLLDGPRRIWHNL
jgi:protein tyrosine phosphatase (PTP) superfamily phosphohydrolase (DUF442 family)